MNPTTLVWRTSVSPQHFTCLAVSLETLVAESPWRRVGASDVPCVGRVGIEPTFRRGKNPLQSQRLLPTQLPRHGRSRNTPNRERARHGSVLPPGVEPGSLGFQPSALTNCAKEGCAARAGRWERPSRAALFHQVPCQAPHHHRYSFFRDHRRPLRAHLRRSCFRGLRGRRNRVL